MSKTQQRPDDLAEKASDPRFLRGVLGCLLDDIEGGHADKCQASENEYDTPNCELCSTLDLANSILMFDGVKAITVRIGAAVALLEEGHDRESHPDYPAGACEVCAASDGLKKLWDELSASGRAQEPPAISGAHTSEPTPNTKQTDERWYEDGLTMILVDDSEEVVEIRSDPSSETKCYAQPECAARIVACVNACRGIPTDQLLKGDESPKEGVTANV